MKERKLKKGKDERKNKRKKERKKERLDVGRRKEMFVGTPVRSGSSGIK